MSTVVEYTVPEKILLAAMELEEQGQTPFSAEMLVVTSWRKFPRTFGLSGYAEQYPDSNRVLASIMGNKGLARKAWLVRTGRKLYALTREGRRAGEQLLSGLPIERVVVRTKLTRDQEKFLYQLFGSAALQLLQEGRKQEITFADACRYWGIDGRQGPAVDATLKTFRTTLAEIGRFVGSDGTTLSDGRLVSAREVQQLTDLDVYLDERFGRHLNLLRTRVDRG